MLDQFRTYQLAVLFHKKCEVIQLKHYLREQMSRASSSIVLNIAEGSGRQSLKDQRRFYSNALGSLRECQAICDLSTEVRGVVELRVVADKLGAHLWRLIHTSETFTPEKNKKPNGNRNQTADRRPATPNTQQETGAEQKQNPQPNGD